MIITNEDYNENANYQIGKLWSLEKTLQVKMAIKCQCEIHLIFLAISVQ